MDLVARAHMDLVARAHDVRCCCSVGVWRSQRFKLYARSEFGPLRIVA